MNAFQVFSFVEAAVLLVAVAVLYLLFARGERRSFQLPGGDGGVVLAAGLWAALLLVLRLFDKPGITTHGVVLAIRPPRANRSPTAGNPRAGVACAWWVPARESTALVAFLAAKLGQVSPPRTRGTAPETHERSRTV